MFYAAKAMIDPVLQSIGQKHCSQANKLPDWKKRERMGRHYVDAKMFAGFYDVTKELLGQANAFIQGKLRMFQE